ncbi:glucose-methanol-choline oxidoreductase domain protein [Mycobacterium xenopi 4042]|uniref:Glucose-methanol-choline oxidoreductase domain protein n=1 Tax=Mycobacterium xenopi 4042 TaxID=1299334 RepID=X8CL88_MYCXE|nr:glucose-methanol-choline oxidoreductase domain protein [Mycobacterium xenopi 4042]
MSDYELKAASIRGDGVDWPLSYEDLAPYYDIVEQTLVVHGICAGIPNCPDGQFIGRRRRPSSKNRSSLMSREGCQTSE